MQEKIFEGIFALCALLSIFGVLMTCFFLFVNAIPTIGQIGFFDFIFGMDWYPTEGILESFL